MEVFPPQGTHFSVLSLSVSCKSKISIPKTLSASLLKVKLLEQRSNIRLRSRKTFFGYVEARGIPSSAEQVDSHLWARTCQSHQPLKRIRCQLGKLKARGSFAELPSFNTKNHVYRSRRALARWRPFPWACVVVEVLRVIIVCKLLTSHPREDGLGKLLILQVLCINTAWKVPLGCLICGKPPGTQAWATLK